jgi:hypothetical protein
MKISNILIIIAVINLLSCNNKYLDVKGYKISSKEFVLESHKDFNTFYNVSNVINTMDTLKILPVKFKITLPKNILYHEVLGNTDFAFYYDNKQTIFIKVLNYSDEKANSYEANVESFVQNNLHTSGSKFDILKDRLLDSRTSKILSKKRIKILLFNIQKKNVKDFEEKVNNLEFL